MDKMDKPLQYLPIPLTGKWRPAVDGTQLSEGDFQTLTNMRYIDTGIKSVTGMTQINTAVIHATNLKTRGGIHFKKDQPSESHILVQAFNAAENISMVYENTAIIPAQGSFTATQVWSDTSGANYGKFSMAPDGCVTYANEKDTCIWGGNEYRCAGFIISDLTNTILYDYTKAVNNTLTDSLNVATMYRSSIGGGVDANCLLMLHLNNNVTDSSPTTPHTVTNNNVAFSDSFYKFGFGTHSSWFNSTTAYMTIPDNTDFDRSSGTWTIDFWMCMEAKAYRTIYYKGTDANNYMSIYVHDHGGATTYGHMHLDIVAAGTAVVQLTGDTISNSVWYHVAVVESANNYYLFINGNLVSYVSDADRAVAYTGGVFIGSTSTPDNYFAGYLDEFRISNSARWTASFVPPVQAYTTTATTNECYCFVASTRPIKGVKFYVSTANTAVATAKAYYWADSQWNLVSSMVDGTATSGGTITLGQIGSITFTSTVTTAKVKSFNKTVAYWYMFQFTGADAATKVSYCTVDAPFQQIVDLWDGVPRVPVATYHTKSGDVDNSINVLKNDYDSADPLTYMDISSLSTIQYMYIGFTERTMGITFGVVNGKCNSNATNMTVSYWDGDEWVNVGTISDGTLSGTSSLAQAGTVTWTAPSASSEFEKSISNNDMWYYYRISFSNALSANCYIDYIEGIPAQRNILGYKFPIMFQNRVGLGCEKSSAKNKLLLSSANTTCVFNGNDSAELEFGDDTELVAAVSLYSRWSGDIYENIIVCKANETWIVDGTSVDTYKLYKIGTGSGCVAPNTLIACDIGYEIAPGINKHVAIWQSATGILMFDGNSIIPIDTDIKNYFDKNKSECINTLMVHKSVSSYDEREREYHWMFASGSSTSLDTELVFDLVHRKWFRINRGTGKYLQYAIPVSDTNGDKYNYGFIDTGYMERLEYGTTFDGTSIISTYKIPDIPVGGWHQETMIRKIKHLARAKSNTASTVSMTHYGDTLTVGDTAETFSVTSSTKRVVDVIKSIGWGPNVFHSLQCSITTNNENTGYEPIGLLVGYKVFREDIR